MNYKKARKKKKLSQIDMAVALGLSLQGWQLIERGVTKNPRPETLKKIEKLLKE